VARRCLKSTISDVQGLGSFPKRAWVLPVLFATASYLLVKQNAGTDYEEVPTFAYSAGLSAYGLDSAANSDDGLFSLLGVPLYDFRTGLGSRLPTQGNWALSPTVYLRFLLNGSQFRFFHVALSTLVMALAWSVCLWRFQLRQPFFRQGVLCVVGLGFVSAFSRNTDWTSTIRINSSIVTVFCAILATIPMNGSSCSSPRFSCKVRQPLLVKCLATFGLGDLIFQHPGALPMASSLLIPAALVLARETYFRRPRLYSPSKKTLICGAAFLVLNVGVIYVDFKNGLGGNFRSYAGDGLAIPNFLEGSFRSNLAPSVEHGLSKLVAMLVLPLLLVPGLELFSSHWRLLIVSSEFQKSGFALIGALPLLFFFIRRRTDPRTIPILRTVLISCTCAVLYTLICEYLSFSALLYTRSSWALIHSTRTILCIALLIATGTSVSRVSLALRTGSLCNLALACLYTLIMLGIVGPYTWAFKQDSARITTASTLHIVRELDTADSRFRTAAIDSQLGRSSGLESISFLEYRSTGIPVVFPVWVKTRPTQPLFQNTGTLGRHEMTLERLKTQTFLDFDRLSDFLNIRNLVVIAPKDTGTDVDLLQIPQFDHVQYPSTSNDNLQVLRRYSFATFYHEDRFGGVREDCVLFEGSCESLSSSSKGPSREYPRFKICKSRCIAVFDFDVPEASREVWLLIPIRYEPIVKILESNSQDYLETRNTGGLLETKLPRNAKSGSLEIYVRPDFVMTMRGLLPILNLALAVLVITPFGSGRKRGGVGRPTRS